MYHGLTTDTFAGLTVLDFSRLLPGPFCTMLLGDLGARVIKVEAPEGGDYARWYPPMVDDAASGYGAFFESLNRGKESVAVDVRKEEGRALVRKLAQRADVVVETFRPGVMDRQGLGPEALRHSNPQLIYCSISGYGQDGPLAQRAGHDLDYLARSGVLAAAGPWAGVPAVPAVQVADLAGGALYAAFSIAAALFRRTRTYQGCVLDVSMAEGVLALMGPMLNGLVRSGRAPERGGDTLTGGFACYGTYRTRDGRFLAVGALEPKFWARFCEVAERPDLMAEGHLMGDEGREVQGRVAELIASRTQAEWMERLEGADACVEPALSLEEVVADAHFAAREAIVHSREGGACVAGPSTPRPVSLSRRAPRLGQHTEQVARELGVEPVELERLRDAGVIAMG